jgi:nicotinate-nucleotide adenylyltransferase
MSNEKLSVGVYGGSFDPPHIAHILVAGWALSLQQIQEVWVIPAGGHPFGKNLVPLEDRMEMCRRAFCCFGRRISILDSEREQGVHYSIDTLRRLIHDHPAVSFRWIMGSDTIEDAPQWKQFEELVRLAPPIIIPRKGHPSEFRDGKAHTSHGKFELPDLSSTWIREKITLGRNEELKSLVPTAVLQWISERGLYQEIPSSNPGA